MLFHSSYVFEIIKESEYTLIDRYRVVFALNKLALPIMSLICDALRSAFGTNQVNHGFGSWRDFLS